jgi:hypothetical protein
MCSAVSQNGLHVVNKKQLHIVHKLQYTRVEKASVKFRWRLSWWYIYNDLGSWNSSPQERIQYWLRLRVITVKQELKWMSKEVVSNGQCIVSVWVVVVVVVVVVVAAAAAAAAASQSARCYDKSENWQLTLSPINGDPTVHPEFRLNCYSFGGSHTTYSNMVQVQWSPKINHPITAQPPFRRTLRERN